MAQLAGKAALVAGGGTGIGRATAALFAAEGARVAVFGRREAPLAETVDAIRKAGGEALAVTGDVGSETDVFRFVTTAWSAWGRVDLAVNSAGIRLRAPIAQISAADFAEVLRVNLVGAFLLTKAVAPAMRTSGGGSIVHIGSAMGTVAAGDFSPYSASKAGLHQFARAAAIELVGDRIRVNVVAPGTIATDIGQQIPAFRARMLEHRIPIGRLGRVQDVAHACLYLAADTAAYVTGAILAVDGGWTAA